MSLRESPPPMSRPALLSRPALRWLVPGLAVAVVLGGGAAIGRFAAVAQPSLPDRTAAQLLVDVQTARLDGMSGTVVQRAALGLPEIPALARGAAGLASLLSGSNTLRVWYAGPDQARIALLSTLGETDVIRNGRDVWVWNSKDNSATHRRLPTGRTATSPAETLATGIPTDPRQLADLALRSIEPSTHVSTGGTARVAGRNAYELILAPRDTGSRVGQIRIAIDAVEHVPLRVEVYPRGSDDTAFEVAFTQISFARPDAEQFRFNPPPGGTVTEATDDLLGTSPRVHNLDRPGAGPSSARLVGTGWTSVLVARMPTGKGSAATAGRPAGKPTAGAGPAELTVLLGALPRVSGGWGSGRLLTGRLFSALLTDDGRLLAGAVGPELLYRAAADPAARIGS